MTQTDSEYPNLVKALASYAPFLPQSPSSDRDHTLGIYPTGHAELKLDIPYELIRQAVKISETTK